MFDLLFKIVITIVVIYCVCLALRLIRFPKPKKRKCKNCQGFHLSNKYSETMHICSWQDYAELPLDYAEHCIDYKRKRLHWWAAK